MSLSLLSKAHLRGDCGCGARLPSALNHPDPNRAARPQINAVLGDMGVHAVKTGMLPSVEVIEAVAAALDRHGVTLRVIDPVIFTASGDELAAAGVDAAHRAKTTHGQHLRSSCVDSGAASASLFATATRRLERTPPTHTQVSATAVEAIKRVLVPTATVLTPNMRAASSKGAPTRNAKQKIPSRRRPQRSANKPNLSRRRSVLGAYGPKLKGTKMT